MKVSWMTRPSRETSVSLSEPLHFVKWVSLCDSFTVSRGLNLFSAVGFRESKEVVGMREENKTCVQ